MSMSEARSLVFFLNLVVLTRTWKSWSASAGPYPKIRCLWCGRFMPRYITERRAIVECKRCGISLWANVITASMRTTQEEIDAAHARIVEKLGDYKKLKKYLREKLDELE